MVQKGVDYLPVDGVEYLSGKLNEGECSVSIASVQPSHYGPWSCTLVAAEGHVLTGKVDIRAG